MVKEFVTGAVQVTDGAEPVTFFAPPLEDEAATEAVSVSDVLVVDEYESLQALLAPGARSPTVIVCVGPLVITSVTTAP